MDRSIKRTCFLCKSEFHAWSSQINPDKIKKQKINLCKAFNIPSYTLEYVNFIANEEAAFCYQCSGKMTRLENIFKEHEDRLKPTREEISNIFVLNDSNPDDRLFKDEVRKVFRSLKNRTSSTILYNGTAPSSTSARTSTSTKCGSEGQFKVLGEDDVESVISNFEVTKSSFEQLEKEKLAQKNNYKGKKRGRPFKINTTDQAQEMSEDSNSNSSKMYNDNQEKVSKSQSTATALLLSPKSSQAQGLTNFNVQQKSPAIRARARSNSGQQPAWLSEVMAEKTPYVPQLGDDLIYFRQGHEKYVERVLEHNLYNLLDDEFLNKLPYIEDPNLSAEIRAKIVKIEYLILPPQIVSLDLAILSWGLGIPTGKIINVKYHVIPFVFDFLILKQIYDKAIVRKWVPGDRFRYYMSTQNSWYVGEVLSKKPLHEKFPDSLFLCYLTKYWKSTVAGDILSPWDMERIEPEFEELIKSYVPEIDGIPSFPLSTSDRDQRKEFYKVNLLDWPNSDQKSDCKRVSLMLTKVMYLPIAAPFRRPVCPTKYPNYTFKVPYPIDICTIKLRLENRFYRRLASLQNDIEHISKNAEKFNDPQAEIISYSKIIRDICLRITTDKTLVNLNMLYDKLLRDYNITDESCALTTNDLTFSTSLGNERSSDQNKAWNEKCLDLLEDLFASEDSFYFRQPVDPDKIPEYYDIIKNPIDLTFIRDEYDWGKYDSPVEFAKDMRLIYSNSRTFNTNKKSQIYEITTRFKNLYQDRLKDIVDEWSRSKRKRKHSENGSSKSSMA